MTISETSTAASFSLRCTQRDKTRDVRNGGRTSPRYKTKRPGGQWGEQKMSYNAGIKNSYPMLIEVYPGEFRSV